MLTSSQLWLDCVLLPCLGLVFVWLSLVFWEGHVETYAKKKKERNGMAAVDSVCKLRSTLLWVRFAPKTFACKHFKKKSSELWGLLSPYFICCHWSPHSLPEVFQISSQLRDPLASPLKVFGPISHTAVSCLAYCCMVILLGSAMALHYPLNPWNCWTPPRVVLCPICVLELHLVVSHKSQTHPLNLRSLDAEDQAFLAPHNC